MDIRSAKLNTKATTGNQFILTGTKAVYTYVNGTRAAEPHAYAYNCKLPERKFDDLSVVIEGPQIMEAPENTVEVAFQDLQLEVKWNKDKGNYITGVATGISPVVRS